MDYRKKILVIDDEPDLTHEIKLGVEETGLYKVFTENKPSQAVATVRSVKPDLILLDITMPGISGPEIAGEIRDDPALCAIPIVFLTGTVFADEVEAHQGIIGGYPFLPKPTSIEQIIDCIKQYLR